MADKRFELGILAIVMVLNLSLSGCATNSSAVSTTGFENRQFEGRFGVPEHTILGPITYESNWWSGILGLSTPQLLFIPSLDLFLFQNGRGGVTYAALLNRAREIFPDADAVVDIQIERTGSTFFVFYSRRRYIVSGIAVRYTREEISPMAPQPIFRFFRRR